jgi:NAD(P)-dependent dehydrogenase (short-subunit alcohol dehydrogenase family)
MLVKNLLPQLAEALGGLGALVNNAALFEPDAADAFGARHRAVNVEAPRLLGEALFALGTEGAVVNMLDAHPNIAGFAGYGQSKRALAELTQDMARRFAPRIRVNGVALGPTLQGVRESAAHFEGLVAAAGGHAHMPEEAARAVRVLLEDPAANGVIRKLA